MNDYIDKHIKWIFSLPTLLFMMLMIAAPLGMTFALSMTDWNLLTGQAPNFNYGINYITLLASPEFWNSFFITFYYTLLALVFELVIGLAVALVLNRSFFGKNIIKTIVLFPYMMAPVAVGLMWTLFYEPSSGLINFLLRSAGLPISSFIGAKTTAIPSIAAVEIWQTAPMVIIICLAGLSTIPIELTQASKVDGANSFQVFRHVTLPLLSPTLYAIGLLRFIDVFKSFDLIYSMTQGGPANASRTLHLYAYELAFVYSKFGMSSAVLTLLFVIILIIILIIITLRKRGDIKV